MILPSKREAFDKNKPLVEPLFKYVEIGNEVPADLFHAAAEVLAYVYELRGRSIVTEVGSGRG